MRLQPILAMFSQTASVLPNDTVVPFSNPHATGNQALYLLISSRTDSYFQRSIKQFEPFGDKALTLLQEQCAHISQEDKSYFHERLVGLKIRENESASTILRARAHKGLSIVILLLPITRILIIKKLQSIYRQITPYTPSITFRDNNFQFSILSNRAHLFRFILLHQIQIKIVYLRMHARTHASS